MLSVQPINYTPGHVSKMQKVAFKGELDKSNNGKFDLSQGAKQFGKGFISPITSMFSSVESFAVTAGIAGAGLFLVNKVKQAGPILIAAGTGFGLFQITKSVVNLFKAKDGDAKEKALYDAGSGFGTVGLAVLTSKPILQNAGIVDEVATVTKYSNTGKTTLFSKFAKIFKPKNMKVEDMSTPRAYAESLKLLPKSIKTTLNKTVVKLDEGLGAFVNILKNKNSYKNFKAGNQQSVAEAATGTKEAVTTMSTVMDSNQAKDIDLKRA